MAETLIERATKEFAGGVLAVDDVTLQIEDGEFMVLVGLRQVDPAPADRGARGDERGPDLDRRP